VPETIEGPGTETSLPGRQDDKFQGTPVRPAPDNQKAGLMLLWAKMKDRNEDEMV